MHIPDVLMLLLATTVIAPLFWEVQPQSNNAAGSIVVPKTMVLSLTTVLKHKYAFAMNMSVTLLVMDVILRPPVRSLQLFAMDAPTTLQIMASLLAWHPCAVHSPPCCGHMSTSSQSQALPISAC